MYRHVHRLGPGGTTPVVSHTCTQTRTGRDCPCCLTHMYTDEDREGPPVLSRTHMYTWARTGRDRPCCPTHMYTQWWVLHCVTCSVSCVMKRFTLTRDSGTVIPALTQVIISWSKQVENLQQNCSLDRALTPSAPPYTVEGKPPASRGGGVHGAFSAHLPVPGYTSRV